jgi:phosphatidylserine decarboxylase
MRIARESLPFAAGAGALAVAAWVFTPWAAVAPVAALAFVLWFFRDPERSIPADPEVVLCPADGRILRAERGRVSVFMNVFDVHVCRSPLSGTLASVTHTPGRFLAAFHDDASEHNERAELVVDGPAGRVRFVLVAGLIARRIVTWVEPGRALRAGDRVGLIRFGSRVDVDLPDGAVPAVRVGDRVVAGETVLARVASATASRAGAGAGAGA